MDLTGDSIPTEVYRDKNGAAPAPHVTVTLYALSTCPVCNTLKHLLNRHGVLHESVDVDLLPADEKARAMGELKRFNPMMSFPTLVAGDTVIAGYQKDKILQLFNIERPALFERLKQRFISLKRGAARR